MEIHSKQFSSFYRTRKINVDGSFKEGKSERGWGYIIRNNEGGVEAAGAGKLNRASDALQAETEALLQAICRAAELGVSTQMSS